MTETEIIDILYQGFYANANYMVDRAFVFDWESDFLYTTRAGFIVEIEIKTDKRDFLNDFKKAKHELMRQGDINTPNRFAFITPNDLVTKDDIPQYAGLYWINENGHLLTIKDAPLIHKDKKKCSPMLCRKYYDRFLRYKMAEIRNKPIGAEVDIQNLRKENARLQKMFDEMNKSYWELFVKKEKVA